MPISSLIPLTGEFSAWKRGRGKPVESIKKSSFKFDFESPPGQGEDCSSHKVVSAQQAEDLKLKEKRKREREGEGTDKNEKAGLSHADLAYRPANAGKATTKMALDSDKILKKPQKKSNKSNPLRKPSSSRTEEIRELFQTKDKKP
ncbi:unnamed protein product [Trifolium pratense]|uniref:Uncharacterized protein n=1 Tax=Trifolium pratense TaxID=57577 RepID=A0ACB0JEU8_TRIPR|nr:unnamed protein product [Trifolium pratense]